MKERFNESATRVLTGEADAEEQRLFEEMLREDEALRHEFSALESAWNESASHETPSFAAEDWLKLEKRIMERPGITKQGEPAPHEKTEMGRQAFIGWQRKLAMAASFALIAAMGWFVWSTQFAWHRYEATEANLHILLPDQSKVVLKKGSVLKHSRNFSESRSLALSGEAYFTVTRDPLHPFEIETGKTITTVLGTAFGIHERKENNTVEIRVVEGKVQFGAGEKQNLILTKGMAASYDNKTGELKNIDFGSQNQVSWAHDVLKFNNTPARAALEDIAHYFEIEIVNKLPKGRDNVPVTADYSGVELKDMELNLHHLLEAKIIIQGNTWTLQEDDGK